MLSQTPLQFMTDDDDDNDDDDDGDSDDDDVDDNGDDDDDDDDVKCLEDASMSCMWYCMGGPFVISPYQMRTTCGVVWLVLNLVDSCSWLTRFFVLKFRIQISIRQLYSHVKLKGTVRLIWSRLFCVSQIHSRLAHNEIYMDIYIYVYSEREGNFMGGGGHMIEDWLLLCN